MKLRVVTYNIHRAIGVDRRFRLDRIAKILSHYDADISLLQEVDVGVPRSRYLNLGEELARWLDYPYYAIGQNVRLKKGTYGNATLSRHPFKYEKNINLTVGSRKRRGCLYTNIQVQANPNHLTSLKVFNLHLGLSLIERVQQVGILVRSSEFQTLDQNVPCLIGGDFNDWRHILSTIFLDILNFNCTNISKSGSRRALTTYPSFSPQGALDRIYYRGNVRLHSVHRCRMIVSKVASDHLPIIAEFDL